MLVNGPEGVVPFRATNHQRREERMSVEASNQPASKGDLNLMAAELRLEIVRIESTMVKWMVSLILPIYAFLIGLLMFLIPHLK